MFVIEKVVSANEPGVVELTRGDVWSGLILKARNGVPFVPAMTACRIVRRRGELDFDRSIVLRGERHVERVRLTPERRVTFTRLQGPVLGTIVNEVRGRGSSLQLGFRFQMVLSGAAPGSEEEREYAARVENDNELALVQTLRVIRHRAASRVSAPRRGRRASTA
jgi:hypothetical protein